MPYADALPTVADPPSPQVREYFLEDVRRTIAESLDSVRKLPLSARKKFPKVLRTDDFQFAIYYRANVLLVAVHNKAMARRWARRELGPHPYPFLVKFPGDNRGEVAAKVTRSRNVSFRDCLFGVGYGLEAAEDATILIEDSTLVTETEQGRISYEISLAYIVMLGGKISEETASSEFDSLVRYSFSQWN